MSKLLGLKGKIRKRKITVKNNLIKNDIECFYLRDDISRCTAGKKECRTSDKKKEQIRYLTDTIGNLYQIYKSEGGKYSISTFYKYKPFHVLAPNVQNRETCLCIKHENFEMLLQTIQKNKILLNCKTVADVTSKVSCDLKSFSCMHRECDKCKTIKLDYQLTAGQLDLDTQWTQYERVDHTYTKTEKGIDKTIHTKKTAKVLKKGSVATLIKSFENSIPAFKMHYYTWKHQQQKYRECINGLNQNEALILCDFSENYICKLVKEIQSMHFGASKQQMTIHTGMVYWATTSQSFCSVSDNNCHEPAAIWAHLMPVIEMVKTENPETKIIHFFSDGPSSQYRQKKNFYLHNLFTSKLKLDYSTWSFTESGHGKGVADGIGGAVKRSLDRQVAYGKDVMNSSQAYDLLNKSMKSVKCFHIQDPEIENIVKIIPKDLSVVPGTMKIHQIVSNSQNKNIMKHRTHSCFCGAKKGLCGCFNPKNIGFYTTERTLNNLEMTPSDTIPVDTDIKNSRTKTSSTAEKDLDEITKTRNNNLEIPPTKTILVTTDINNLRTQKTSSMENKDLHEIT
ncbi:unnamed protein product [Euphydryas editha]|uniref:Uncharacterized protein n=1 Tax=Euphydryas editha TaxID=104508 RepID=A0AAU9UD58_EUPED|nr:unnamed protein product [Euphydryas editha]